MTLELLSKLDNRNTMFCDAIIIFPIYSQFGAIQKLDSGCMGIIFSFSLITFHLIQITSELRNLSHCSKATALRKNVITLIMLLWEKVILLSYYCSEKRYYYSALRKGTIALILLL